MYHIKYNHSHSQKIEHLELKPTGQRVVLQDGHGQMPAQVGLVRVLDGRLAESEQEGPAGNVVAEQLPLHFVFGNEPVDPPESGEIRNKSHKKTWHEGIVFKDLFFLWNFRHLNSFSKLLVKIAESSSPILPLDLYVGHHEVQTSHKPFPQAKISLLQLVLETYFQQKVKFLFIQPNWMLMAISWQLCILA